MKKIKFIVDKTDNGYCAGCELLPGLAVTVSGDFQELEKEIRDCIAFYVECAENDNEAFPLFLKKDYEIEYSFGIESLLNFYGKIFTKAALEHITGINQRQLSHYACGRSKPRKKQADKIINALHALGKELLAVSA